MKLIICRIAFFISAFLFINASTANASNSADGKLTVDGETTSIKYAYADEYEGDITIVLVDNEIPVEMIPDGVWTLGEQGKIKEIVFVVSSDEKKLQTGGLYNLINAIHSYPKWNKLGTVGNGELTITDSQGDLLSGRIKTPSENKVDGHKFTYDAKFSVSLKKEPLNLTVTGKTGQPAEAYKQWGNALFAGDIDSYKKYSSAELNEMFPDDQNEMKEGIEFQQLLMPTNIEILSIDIEGKNAVMKARGTRGSEVSEGTINMISENGAWKVGQQSWESGE